MESASKQTVKNIPVVISTDKNYAPYARVMLTSLLDNLTEGVTCEVIVLHKNLDEDSKKGLTEFAAGKRNCILRFLEVTEKYVEDRHLLTGNYLTEAMYYRLFIADLLPEYDRAVYLDVDIIVEGNILDLYNVDLGDNYLSAIPDFHINTNMKDYLTEFLDFPENHTYFNSGVLVMNLGKLRDDHMSDVFMEVYQKLQTPRFPDQDILNIACLNKTLFLDYDWNLLIGNLNISIDPVKLKNPVKIFHFAGSLKPWMYPEHLNAQVWWKYCRKEAAETLRFHPEPTRYAGKKFELPEKDLQAVYQIGNDPFCFAELFNAYLEKVPDGVEKLCEILYDDASRETVRLGMERLQSLPARKYGYAFFYQPAKLLTDEEKYDWIRHINAQQLYHNTFNNLFSFYEPTEFYYRHGMIWMTDSFLERLKGGIFIDCGAFDGASSLVMSLYRPSHIYAFEPSKTNYQRCMENLKKGQLRADCTILQYCCGNADGTITFSDNGTSGSSVGNGDPVPLCKLDTFVQTNSIPHVDWIKADLEGYALEMIRGAEQIIKSDKPLLTIGTYHCPDEFFEIPYLLKKWVPEYQFMYRRCHCHPTCYYFEDTLIAWVPEPGEERQGIKNVDRYLGPF